MHWDSERTRKYITSTSMLWNESIFMDFLLGSTPLRMNHFKKKVIHISSISYYTSNTFHVSNTFVLHWLKWNKLIGSSFPKVLQQYIAKPHCITNVQRLRQMNRAGNSTSLTQYANREASQQPWIYLNHALMLWLAATTALCFCLL